MKRLSPRDSHGRFTSWEAAEQGQANVYYQLRKGARWKRLSGAAEQSTIRRKVAALVKAEAARAERRKVYVKKLKPRGKGQPARSLPAEYKRLSAFSKFLRPISDMGPGERSRIIATVEAVIPIEHRSAARYKAGLAWVPIEMGLLTARQAAELTEADVIRRARQEGFQDPVVKSIMALARREKRASIAKRVFKRKRKGGRKHGRKED